MSVECGLFIQSRNRHRLGVSHLRERLSIPEPATLVPVPDAIPMTGKAMPEPDTKRLTSHAETLAFVAVEKLNLSRLANTDQLTDFQLMIGRWMHRKGVAPSALNPMLIRCDV